MPARSRTAAAIQVMPQFAFRDGGNPLERSTTRRYGVADQKLSGKKVAIVAADMVERVELVEPRKALVDAGADVTLISLKPGEITTFNHFDPAEKEKVDKTAEEVDASDFDALMIPGGVGNPDQLRGDENVIKFVQEIFEAGKPAAVICHGPWVLVE